MSKLIRRGERTIKTEIILGEINGFIAKLIDWLAGGNYKTNS